MSEKVSTFLNVELRGYRYLFFLVTWNDFVSEIRSELERQIEAFGEVLGPSGAVVQAFKSMSRKTYEEVVGKQWGEKIAKQIRSDPDPFMLIVNVDFRDFDPESNQWSIVRFSDFGESPNSIYRLLAALARKVDAGEDLHKYLRGVAAKEKYKKWSRHFQLKTPEMFGLSINCKAVIEDLVGLS